MTSEERLAALADRVLEPRVAIVSRALTEELMKAAFLAGMRAGAELRYVPAGTAIAIRAEADRIEREGADVSTEQTAPVKHTGDMAKDCPACLGRRSRRRKP
jgi:hypothetical protein